MPGQAKVITALGIVTLIISVVLFYWSWGIYQLSGQTILDAQFFGRNVDMVDHVLGAYQGTGSPALYEKVQRLDLLYPFAYGGFGVLWLYYVFKPSKWRFICVVPAFSALFDLMENNLLAKITEQYPVIDADMVALSSTYTQLKYGLIVLSLIILFIGLARRKKQRAASAG
mgnify:CR=1 FL=1